MAIEIREIHIKAVVNEAGERAPASTDGSPPKSGGMPEGESGDQLISQCVEKVMEILKEKMER
jgi:Family of unknown function (DUF5908)